MLPRLLVSSATRHFKILFLYQPFSVRASLDIFSKSFTFGGLNEACQMPANIPTPKTGFNTKKGAVTPERRQVRNDAPPMRVNTKVEEALATIHHKNAFIP